jgi:thiosulfate reductase cytochrome b subunit
LSKIEKLVLLIRPSTLSIHGILVSIHRQSIVTHDDGWHHLPKFILSQSIIIFVILNLVNPRFNKFRILQVIEVNNCISYNQVMNLWYFEALIVLISDFVVEFKSEVSTK